MHIFQVDWEGGLLKVRVEKQTNLQLNSQLCNVDSLFYANAFHREASERGVYLKATSQVSHLTRVQLSMCLICCRYRLKAKGLKTSKNWIWLRYRPGRASPESMPDAS